MGCWNGTCGISRLPIFCGDPVRMILLKRTGCLKREGKIVGFTYSHSMMVPILFPIMGEYNDYGTIDNVQDGFTLRKIKELTGVENTDELMKSLERGKLYLPSSHPEYGFLSEDTNSRYDANISFMLIHEEIYQHVLKLICSNDDMFGLERIIENANEFKKKVKEILIDNPEDELEVARMDMLFTNSYRDFTGSKCDWETVGVEKHIFEHKNDIEDIVQDIIDFDCLTCFMNMARIGFVEQVGAGSQTEALDFHIGLAEKVIDMANRRTKQYE